MTFRFRPRFARPMLQIEDELRKALVAADKRFTDSLNRTKVDSQPAKDETKMTTVKYANPQNEAEAAQRFTVIEDRDTRLLVELVCDMPLRPTFCFAKSDFVEVA